MRDIPLFKPYVSPKAAYYVADTLRSGWIGEGPRVKAFEKELCTTFKWRHAVAVNSGTSAIRLALALAGVGPGDEVISTPNTCTATNTAILEQYAKPVFADIQYMTGNLNPKDITHRITEKTRAIVCVHWAGYPCDMAEIHEIASQHNLAVIEDAAHALGASYHEAPIGCASEFTCFSFQAIKTLTTGDGGALVTLHTEIAERARVRRWFGVDREKRTPTEDGYWHWPQTEPGYKHHMNDIAASIGLANLEEVDHLINQRRYMAQTYRSGLKGVHGVTLFESSTDRESGNWLFTIHVQQRADFIRALRSRGVEAGIVHLRNDVHPVFGGRRDDLPEMDRYEKTHVSIPIHNRMTLEDAAYVVEAVKEG